MGHNCTLLYLLRRQQQRRRPVAIPLLQVSPRLGIPPELDKVTFVRRNVGVDTSRSRL